MGYTANRDVAELFREDSIVETSRRITERVGAELRDRVRERTPVAKPPPGAWAEWLAARKRRPGHLKDSWRIGEVRVTMGGRTMSIPVFTLDPVAPHVEWDTQPHLIVPRNPRGTLRYWDRHGAIVFAQVVHHPGTRGVHMMATALMEVAVAWDRVGAEEVQRWAREYWK